MRIRHFAKQGVLSLMFFLAYAGSPVLAAGTFSLTSPNLKDGGTVQAAQVYAGYGCAGENISPALSWQGAPAATRSYAVTVFDPDARTGKGWWHWLIYNLPAGTTGLPANAGDVAAGLAPKDSVQSVTDFDAAGYGGPCPPIGDKPHRYVFTVFALNIERVPLAATSPPETVRDMLDAHALAKASFTAYYGR